MNGVSEESAEVIALKDARAKKYIAWRSLVMSLAIFVIALVLYAVSLAQAGLRGFDPERSGWMTNHSFQVCVQYGFTIPFCLGGLYLATKIRRRWLLHVSLYLTAYLQSAVTFALVARIPRSAAWDFFSPVAVSFPLVFLVTLPVRMILKRTGYFERLPEEKPVFGISSMLWGSTIVAMLVFLVMWTYELGNERRAKGSLGSLTYYGATYNEATQHLTFHANNSTMHPIGISSLQYLHLFKERISIEFIDCEITDESIAYLKQKRSSFGKIQFVNCKVVKEVWPSHLFPIGNEANEPLPDELPR